MCKMYIQCTYFWHSCKQNGYEIRPKNYSAIENMDTKWLHKLDTKWPYKIAASCLQNGYKINVNMYKMYIQNVHTKCIYKMGIQNEYTECTYKMYIQCTYFWPSCIQNGYKMCPKNYSANKNMDTKWLYKMDTKSAYTIARSCIQYVYNMRTK